jgi:threonine aldolase
MFCQATTEQLVPKNQLYLTAAEIERALTLGINIHHAPTRLICLENTMSGMVFPQDEIIKISELAKKHNITLHCDGARLWNVAAKVIEERGLDTTSEEDRRTV